MHTSNDVACSSHGNAADTRTNVLPSTQTLSRRVIATYLTISTFVEHPGPGLSQCGAIQGLAYFHSAFPYFIHRIRQEPTFNRIKLIEKQKSAVSPSAEDYYGSAQANNHRFASRSPHTQPNVSLPDEKHNKNGEKHQAFEPQYIKEKLY